MLLRADWIAWTGRIAGDPRSMATKAGVLLTTAAPAMQDFDIHALSRASAATDPPGRSQTSIQCALNGGLWPRRKRCTDQRGVGVSWSTVRTMNYVDTILMNDSCAG